MRSGWWILFGALLSLGACDTSSDLFGPGHAGGGGSGGGTGGDDRPPAFAERVDLLLVIDNSRSMADKQEVLGQGLGELINSLVNPLCLDAKGLPIASQPTSPAKACPDGSARPFEPIADLHIGVITTSLGGHGADACSGQVDPSENDHGHLITRAPRGQEVFTYENLGFLAWDPKTSLDPPGLADPEILETHLKGLVLGAGQRGCGYEASLESWYRFLVDPAPYQTIKVEGNEAVMSGTDDVLLQQRADFLRPDSLLAIVVLSDENDCSMREGGVYYAAAQILEPGGVQLYHLPRARAACDEDPNDRCCRSCGQPAGLGCNESADNCTEPLDDLEDNFNLRCFDQKRRFGVDFLYPIDRYNEALTLPEVSDRNGKVVPNPIFSDLDPYDDINQVRDERLVFLTAIVGVPWQDIARRTGSIPDLQHGADAGGTPKGGFQTADELVASGTWSLILGDPPADPLMIESIEPRSGVHPVTGQLVAPPGASATANVINGHEYSIPLNDDLQYACIFTLLVPRDCSTATDGGCDCTDPGNDSPLCQNAQGAYTTTQYRAKAYPAIRHLELVKALGTRGTLASICPVQLNVPTAEDYAYLPVVQTLIETIAPSLPAEK